MRQDKNATLSASDDMTEKDLPLVTVCTPVKNRAWSLKAVLSSLEGIQYPKHKLKLVFVDDFSTDGSYEFLTEWSTKARSMKFYDIKIVRAKTNIPQARNLCIEYMEGEYLLYWDSDVVSPKDLLKKMVQIMKEKPYVGIIGADYVYEPSLRVQYKPVVNKETHAVYMGFTLIRREVFKIVGGFNENLSVGEDTEFCIRVTEKTNYKIVWAPEPVLHLKRPHDVKGRGLFRSSLKYTFYTRAEEYFKSFASLPRFLKARILYYLAMPWIIGLGLIMYALNKHIVSFVIALLYILPSLYLIIRQRGLKYGVITWVKFNLPIGLALSYGILVIAIKRFCKILIQKFKGSQ